MFRNSVLVVLLVTLRSAVHARIVGDYEMRQVLNRWFEEVPLPHLANYDLKVAPCRDATPEAFYCLTFNVVNTFYVAAPRDASRVNVTSLDYVSSTQRKPSDDGEAELELRIKSILDANSPELARPRSGRLTVKSPHGRIVFTKKDA